LTEKFSVILAEAVGDGEHNYSEIPRKLRGYFMRKKRCDPTTQYC